MGTIQFFGLPHFDNLKGSAGHHNINIKVEKGDELGRFIIGSTILVVKEIGNNDINFNKSKNQKVKVREDLLINI